MAWKWYSSLYSHNIIAHGIPDPEIDGISYPVGWDSLGKCAPGHVFMVDRFSSNTENFVIGQF